jgi:RNA polymerase sigma-70 factor (ECF subfamily)
MLSTTHETIRVNDPDRDVRGLVGAGDVRGALHHLMRRHGAAVYRYCREALRDGALADDVHQQVFIEAFRDLPRFEGRSTVRAWLLAIARNRVLDAVRARSRAQPHPVKRSTTPGCEKPSSPASASSTTTSGPPSYCATSKASRLKKWPRFVAKSPARYKPGWLARCRNYVRTSRRASEARAFVSGRDRRDKPSRRGNR